MKMKGGYGFNMVFNTKVIVSSPIDRKMIIVNRYSCTIQQAIEMANMRYGKIDTWTINGRMVSHSDMDKTFAELGHTKGHISTNLFLTGVVIAYNA